MDLMYSLGILNGKVYVKGDFIDANVYVKDGKIAAISSEVYKCDKTYDASGFWVLPGFIDPHVHMALRVGKWLSVDDFYTGSVSAAFGGITTMIDFIDPARSTNEIEEYFKRRLEEAKESLIDYAFHSTIADPVDSAKDIALKSMELGMASIKLFTTYSSTNRRTYDPYIDELLSLSSVYGFVVLAHAENDEMIKRFERIGNILPKDHSKARPTISEVSEVVKLAEMTKFRNGQLYIVHVSSGITAKEVYERFGDLLGEDLVLESCPHYFYLDESYFSRPDGVLYLMTPPLRSAYERDLLHEYFNVVFTLGTDHCPFMKEDKFSGKYTNEIPQGIGGVEFSFSLMFTLFGEEAIDKFTENVARSFGLYPKKGVIEVGSDADFCVFDPEKEWVIKNHHSKSDYTVYEGIKVKGKVVSTILRGEFIVKDGELVAEGKGEFVPVHEIFW